MMELVVTCKVRAFLFMLVEIDLPVVVKDTHPILGTLTRCSQLKFHSDPSSLHHLPVYTRADVGRC